MKRKLIALLFILFLSGCAGVVNPYKGSFTCPEASDGKCVGIPEAYQESIASTSVKAWLQAEAGPNPIEQEYASSLFLKLQKMLKEPKTPMLYPPTVIRVLILPYEEEGKNFYNARFVYSIVDDPKWILQNIINMPADAGFEEIELKSENPRNTKASEQAPIQSTKESTKQQKTAVSPNQETCGKDICPIPQPGGK